MQGCPSSLFGNEPVTLSAGLLLLENEHEPLREMLESLASLCHTVKEKRRQAASFEQLVVEVNAFLTKLDYHSVREEDYLFRMMEVYIGKNGGPIAVMEYEHERAKGLIKEFINKSNDHTQLTTDQMVQYSNLIIDAYHTLLDHFSKEEQVLYPMAERMFTQEEKDLLLQKVS